MALLPCQAGSPWIRIANVSCASSTAKAITKKKLLSLHASDQIALRSYLVGPRDIGLLTWYRSPSRTNVGDGAGEAVWLEHFRE